MFEMIAGTPSMLKRQIRVNWAAFQMLKTGHSRPIRHNSAQLRVYHFAALLVKMFGLDIAERFARLPRSRRTFVLAFVLALSTNLSL